MGAMGEYEFPDITVSQAVDIARVIEEKNVERTDVLAKLLGHEGPTAHKGGSFRSKLAALDRYGLLVGKQIDLHLSDSAKQIIHPRSTAERDEAVWRAAMTVPLLQKVHEKLRGKVPSDFWVPLYDCTGVDQKLAKDHADEVKRLYSDAIRYFQQSSETPRAVEPPVLRDQVPAESRTTETVPETMMRFRSGDIDVSLPISDRNLDVMLALLDSLRGDAHGPDSRRPQTRNARRKPPVAETLTTSPDEDPSPPPVGGKS